MTLIIDNGYNDASSICTDITTVTIDSLDFEDVDMYEPPSLGLEEVECTASTASSPLQSRPPTPLSQTHLSEVGTWEDLTISYLKAVQRVRQIEDEMFDVRYRKFHLSINTDSKKNLIGQQPRHQAYQRGANSLPDRTPQTSDVLQDQHSPIEIFQDNNCLGTDLNEGVELSVVSLDTLHGKKTMISLSVQGKGACLRQLLGFWEFRMPGERHKCV